MRTASIQIFMGKPILYIWNADQELVSKLELTQEQYQQLKRDGVHEIS